MLAVPGYVALAVEPVAGLFADHGHRRRLILAGGVLFAVATALLGLAPGFAVLLGASVLAAPASGSFVGLAQTVLVDATPRERERAMARWTLAGSLGVVLAPLALAGSLALGSGWRPLFLALGIASLGAVVAARRLPTGGRRADGSFATTAREAARLLKSREVLRWLALLQASDLMLDVFSGFLALYLVDVAHASPVEAALGIAVWTGAGLVGDALLLVVLRHAAGLRCLRWSALLVVGVYPAFLLVPSMTAKLAALGVLGLLNSGWYAIPQAKLYETVGERSGSVFALATVGGTVGSSLPLVIGAVAGAAGLGVALWISLLAPLALLLGLPRKGESAGGGRW